MLRRVPIESSRESVLVVALARVLLALAGLLSAAIVGFPEDGTLAAVAGGLALPWALITLVLAHIRPAAAFHPLFPVVDMAVLVTVEAVAPDTYGAVRFAALLLIAVHAHLQGAVRGVIIAAGTATAMILAASLTTSPVSGGLLVFYELTFFVAAVGVGLLVGRMRTTESAGRLRARDLTRRTLGSEAEGRRRLAESIHDGPLQELIGLDMMLAAARQATQAGDDVHADEVLEEAHGLAQRSIEGLRGEIVALGPEAFQELDFEEAVKACLPAWRQRFGVDVELEADSVELSSELAGDLFRIAQEAVNNAGRHAHAAAIRVRLFRSGGIVELRVSDDGEGFGGLDSLGPAEPGHLGLAAIRERTALHYGELRIESSDAGTDVIVRVPLAPPA